jgi:hypothetical protein
MSRPNEVEYHYRIASYHMEDVFDAYRAGKISKKKAIQKFENAVRYVINPYKDQDDREDIKTDKGRSIKTGQSGEVQHDVLR